ncbi:MAG: hypothetical protein ACRBG0_21735 [Lewinella sp.]|uniref:hypothetical protein n=1 Tax=Lewinella sp. TaxID=2004506 RepID=UPI003D6B270E
MKTREEVDNLKKLWLDDPKSFDLTKVEGYEEYQDELAAFVRRHQSSKNEEGSLGFIPKILLSSIPALIGGLTGKSSEESLEEIALPIIKKMVREAPEPLNEQLVQGYYEQIGFDAYQRAHYILTGREKFARTKCPCVACSMKRMEEE